MKRRIPLLLAALALPLLLCACGSAATAPDAPAAETPAPAATAEPAPVPATPEPIESSLYVKAVENLPDDFILGMDVSSLLAEEASGVRYYDFNGQERDLMEILAENGLTHIRVRVWNDPYDASGRGYGGGNCDIDCSCALGARAAKAGLKLIVDFHYSDFWADPGKQMVPKAWKGMEIEEKTQALYEFTKDSLEKLRSAGADVAMVQIGNETNQFLCGEKRWFNIQYLLQAGAKAVREVCPEALVAVHFANPEKEGSYLDYAWRLDYYNVDYDVFASSYYPYWHGTQENLSSVLGEIAETYGKKVLVMETSWAYTPEDTDFSGNTIGEGSAVTKPWPYTVQGQANAVRSVVDTVAHTKNGIGVVYWEGAWISVGTESWEENSALWEKHGSGWASSFSAGYDPEDAGKYYGGCAVDNQAFFDPTGRPLESLRLFRLLREGNAVPVAPDAVQDVEMTVDLNGAIALPETVDAVMNDDSRQAVPVTWSITPEELEQLRAGGEGKYTIDGVSGGLPAKAYLSLVEFNFLQNGGFEDGDLRGWTLTDLAGADQLYAEEKKTDSLSGAWHMHFWSAKSYSVEFTLEQTPEGLDSGSYRFSISIMGGDAGEQEVYAYVKKNGETVATAPLEITSYGSWDTGSIEGIEYEAGEALTVGIYVKCQGTGSGAWGKIDDAALNSM